MALRTTATFRRGWEWLKDGASRAGRVRPHISASAAAKVVGCGLADLLFPPSCASCAAELDESASADRGVRLCETCLEGMEIFSEPMCVRCGAPVPRAVSVENQLAANPQMHAGCYRCSGRKLWFDETIALGTYDGALRNIVLRMKNAEGDSLSLTMSRL